MFVEHSHLVCRSGLFSPLRDVATAKRPSLSFSRRGFFIRTTKRFDATDLRCEEKGKDGLRPDHVI